MGGKGAKTQLFLGGKGAETRQHFVKKNNLLCLTERYTEFYENFAAQELKAHGYSLYYFNNKRQGELDFVIEDRGHVLPIEIKSGKDYKRHNALSNVMSNEEYRIPKAIVFSNGNVERVANILYYPIYMLMYLQPEVLANPIFKFEPI